MDPNRFDAIARTLSRLSRRRVLGGLTAGTLAPLLGLGGHDAGAALPVCQRSSDCPEGQTCAHNVCVLKCVNGDALECNDPSSGTGCGSTCFCGMKRGGGKVCLQLGGICREQRCRKQKHCAAGEICATGCCGPNVPRFTCIPGCFA